MTRHEGYFSLPPSFWPLRVGFSPASVAGGQDIGDATAGGAARKSVVHTVTRSSGAAAQRHHAPEFSPSPRPLFDHRADAEGVRQSTHRPCELSSAARCRRHRRVHPQLAASIPWLLRLLWRLALITEQDARGVRGVVVDGVGAHQAGMVGVGEHIVGHG